MLLLAQIFAFPAKSAEKAELTKSAEGAELTKCVICMDHVPHDETCGFKPFDCPHDQFHEECITKFVTIAESIVCPHCRADPTKPLQLIRESLKDSEPAMYEIFPSLILAVVHGSVVELEGLLREHRLPRKYLNRLIWTAASYTNYHVLQVLILFRAETDNEPFPGEEETELGCTLDRILDQQPQLIPDLLKLNNIPELNIYRALKKTITEGFHRLTYNLLDYFQTRDYFVYIPDQHYRDLILLAVSYGDRKTVKTLLSFTELPSQTLAEARSHAIEENQFHIAFEIQQEMKRHGFDTIEAPKKSIRLILQNSPTNLRERLLCYRGYTKQMLEDAFVWLNLHNQRLFHDVHDDLLMVLTERFGGTSSSVYRELFGRFLRVRQKGTWGRFVSFISDF